jgi:RNA polymerase sigma factor (sigma-70 family)
MMTDEAMRATECSDAELVSCTLAGDRDAFSRIVSRYQILICSLAYSRIGNLGLSEDVAQETFITAWKHLRLLREPEKLRAWLCGIVRNRIHKSLEREGREPAHDAAPLEAVDDSPAREALPSEQAISREEEAILWRSLERIPELYREPLILFYREHQSIERVAGALELSEDAVKQRLSRGRKLLQEEVQAFVENTLRRTAPDQAFSGAVLAMLPLAAAGPAATVGIGAGAKGSAAAKSGFLALWLAPLAPFLGIAAGVGAQWLIIRNTTPERGPRLKRLALVIAVWVVYLGLFIALENTLRWLAGHLEWGGRVRFVAFAGFYWSFILATITVQLLWIRRMKARWQARVDAGEIPPKPMTPMSPGTLAAVVAGGHLMLFSWLMTLAWRFHDPMGVAILTGAVLVLCIAAFFRIRAAAATEVLRVTSSHLALCGTVILLTLNQRIDVWVASAYGVTVAEAQRLQPTWIVPLLSLAFVCWTALLIALIKPKRR